ncbi:hypothetical protein ACFQBQ_14950 [Granulicella cerasi]|uniref:Uncharacterized protein n=1 Tax=Granulicella cerasi TaxID=741063 RepID=A0ABW1ZCN2_9BACT|nr:hypothetical protein [Granulicella cerasi]
MSFNILQKKSAGKESSCKGNCPGCKNALRRAVVCPKDAPCAGYGTSEACPPMIVFAVAEQALRALAAATLPAFGSSARSVYS